MLRFRPRVDFEAMGHFDAAILEEEFHQRQGNGTLMRGIEPELLGRHKEISGVRRLNQEDAAGFQRPRDLVNQVQAVIKWAVLQNMKGADRREGLVGGGAKEVEGVILGDLETGLPTLGNGGRVGIYANRLVSAVAREAKPFS